MDTQVRLRLIYELLSKAEERGYDIGRTKLQKLFYFLKVCGVDTSYRFNLRHYGPYSDQLANDLGILTILDAVNVEADPTGYGYHIHPKAPAAGVFRQKLATHQSVLNYVLDRFGNLDAGDLEVMATIQFATHVLESKEGRADKRSIIDIVHALKPKYAIGFVDACYERLNSTPLPQQLCEAEDTDTQEGLSFHRS